MSLPTLWLIVILTLTKPHRYSQIWFTLLCMFPKYRDWDYKYTTIGLFKKRARATLKLVALTLAIIGTYRARQAGLGLLGLKEVTLIFRTMVARLLYAGGDALRRMAGSV